MRYQDLLKRLSRVTQSSAIIPEIDGLRFLAILPVVLLHLSTNYLRVNTAGFTTTSLNENNLFFQILYKGSLGVNVFFVISGFVLALPFAISYGLHQKEIDLKKYYLRRLTRLEPPFIISLLCFFIVLFLVGKYDLTTLIKSLLASVTYTHYFIFGAWSIINPISWSLETEVQFYLLAPALFTIYFIREWRIRFIVGIVVSFTICLGVSLNQDLIREFHLAKSLLVYFLYFASGIFLADVFTKNKLFFDHKSRTWDLFGIAGIVGVYMFHHTYYWYSGFGECISILLIFIGAFKGIILNKFFTKKEVVVVGGMCYSIYLLHYGLLFFLMKFTGYIHYSSSFAVNYFLQALLILPIVLIVSSVFFILFEKPFMYRDWYKDFPKGYFSRLNK